MYSVENLKYINAYGLSIHILYIHRFIHTYIHSLIHLFIYFIHSFICIHTYIYTYIQCNDGICDVMVWMESVMLWIRWILWILYVHCFFFVEHFTLIPSCPGQRVEKRIATCVPSSGLMRFQDHCDGSFGREAEFTQPLAIAQDLLPPQEMVAL